MITLFFAPLTRAIRIRWLLEELGLDYRIVETEFDRKAGPAGQNTPSGRFPVLQDGEVTLSESGAIVQYLIETYGAGRLQPEIGSIERPNYLFWIHYAEGSMAQSINQFVYLSLYRDDADRHAELIAANRLSAEKRLDEFEAAISGRQFLVGDDISGADIMMGFTLWSAMMLRLLDEAHPETLRYLKTLTARPAFANALSVR